MNVRQAEIYLSRDMRVVSRIGFSKKAILVTFDSFTDIRNLNRRGFGEDFLAERKIDAIHFISRENDWYQYPNLPDAAAIVAEISSEYEMVIAYGSSMGGYAAIRFGRMVGASLAIACSPQYSIDPSIVPFENRWLAEVARIGQFPFECHPPCEFIQEAVVFYDPRDLDQKHVDLYEGKTKLLRITTPNSGHPCTGFLAEIGILQDALSQIVSGEFCISKCRREIRRRRRDSPQLYFNLSRRVRDINLQFHFAKCAVEFGDRVPEYISQYGKVLAAMERYQEAEAAHLRALALAPDNPVTLYHLSDHYEQAGAIDKAFTVMEHLVQVYPDAYLYRPRFEYLRDLIALSDRAPATDSRPIGTNTLNEPMPELSIPTPRGSSGRIRRLLATAAKKFWAKDKQILPATCNRIVTDPMAMLPLEQRVTVFPSPPPLLSSWRRHSALLSSLPVRGFDVLLVGDSLVEYWPEEFWKPASTFNLGIAADKTQHVIWRLNEIYPGRLMARYAVLLIGTNNLGAGDEPEGIVAGITSIIARLRVIAPKAQIVVIEIPPCGPEFSFRRDIRIQTNALIQKIEHLTTLNIDNEITCGFSSHCDNYHEDKIHFSTNGYGLLTKTLMSHISLKKAG